MTVLQWRAGQLPGQTTAPQAGSKHEPSPSMEGRTIARPDSDRRLPVRAADAMTVLQWRAGQLPGQTALHDARRYEMTTFNGGPDNCPARLVNLPNW